MAVQYAFGKIITQGLDLNVDAADPTSYPGSGTSWTNVVNRSITGSVISCSFSSDFKGGLVFNNPSASVVFPGSVANYGSGSFTVEMAFRPDQIEGKHYLVSKNSGSYPNWGVYLSGSGGSGKLWAEYNIDATVSCSVSSSTVLTTSSAYQTDITFNPITTTIVISLDGAYDVISPRGNGTGSLGTTGSLFVGNTAFSSSVTYSGSILNNKIYSIETSGYSNYKTLTPRVSKPIPNRPPKMQVLVVAGGGGGGSDKAGGGGAGGVIWNFLDTIPGTYSIEVGGGGASRLSPIRQGLNGTNSTFGSLVAVGGGGGGGDNSRNGLPGGSGGGASRNGTPGTSSITQGNPGGSGSEANINDYSGGGGGGAGSIGGTVNPSTAGIGGSGLAFSITGLTTYYAGGGGGGMYLGTGIGGAGGIGGGGKGGNSSVAGIPGDINTGGGGGGGGGSSLGGAGGSGIVVVRYPGPPIASGGTITQVGGDTIHTFTETGSHTFTVF